MSYLEKPLEKQLAYFEYRPCSIFLIKKYKIDKKRMDQYWKWLVFNDIVKGCGFYFTLHNEWIPEEFQDIHRLFLEEFGRVSGDVVSISDIDVITDEYYVSVQFRAYW